MRFVLSATIQRHARQRTLSHYATVSVNSIEPISTRLSSIDWRKRFEGLRKHEILAAAHGGLKTVTCVVDYAVEAKIFLLFFFLPSTF